MQCYWWVVFITQVLWKRAGPLPAVLSLMDERTQPLQILSVPVTAVLVFWGFDNFRNIYQSIIIHDVFKSVRPDESQSDMLVPIYTAAQVFFGVVQVQQVQMLQSNNLIESGKRFLKSITVSDVITGGKDMRSVQAETDFILVFDLFHH